MAAVEQRIPRSRSSRLADQAATAALYVTHPERRLSLREPATAESDLTTLKATGSRPGFSHASAVAALARAEKRETGAKQAAAGTLHAADHRVAEVPSYEGYQAAICAVRDSRVITGLPSLSTSVKHGIATGQVVEGRRIVSQRDRAVSAASGAYGGRRRADSAPSQAARVGTGVEGAGDPFEDLDRYMNASRIQNMAVTNARLYTATPPVSIEVEEHRRKSILEAAAISMAKEMYGATESREGGPSGGVAAARRGHARARSQRSVSKPDAAILQQAVSIQDIAQRRAAEKLASLEDETVVYREYYGIERQATRSSFSVRRRRGSNETDSSVFDMERSREIRTQMSTLRSKLNAVDEQRERDRATLLEVARKNVDAALQDMEMRVYAETGRAPASMQKELEETAMLRTLQGKKEADAQYPMADKINIGSQKYVDMADVEALARSRLQPTFDEIDNIAQTQRAKELEERLDEEREQRLREIEYEREADIRKEEKRHKAFLKQELKSKEEKTRLWRRKSRRVQSNEAAIAKGTKTETEKQVNGVAPEAEPATEGMEEQQEAEGGPAVVSGAVAEEAQMEPVTKQESKIKSWFKDRLRRSSVTAAEPSKGVSEQQAEEGVKEGPEVAGAAEGTQNIERAELDGAHEATEPEGEQQQIATTSTTGGAADAPTSNSRAAALRSHPVTANDLNAMQNGGASIEREEKLNGMTPGEYLATRKNSKELVEHSNDMKHNRLKSSLKKIVSRNSPAAKSTTSKAAEQSTTPEDLLTEREALRESATDHGLEAPPPVGDPVSKRLSNGSTIRESRFSEDL